MKKLYSFSILCASLFFVSSCKSVDNMSYMKDVDNEISSQIASQHVVNTIQPGDQLVIVVDAKDGDVVRPFNKNYSSTEVLQYSESNNNMPLQSQTKASIDPTYKIDSNGMLDFPVIGTIKTTGKTVEELKEELRGEISRYVKNPVVSVKNTNFKVTVLGEVNKPGYFIMPEGQTATLFSALGMAGDLTVYGERDKILLVRNVDGETTKQYLDISSSDFGKSPYFYLKQNDIIYVTANKAKRNSSNFGPQTAVWISVGSIVVTILALVIKK